MNFTNNSITELKYISSFKNVKIEKKTLIMCDIDDTILTFYPYDWNKMYQFNLMRYKTPEMAMNITNQQWYDIVTYSVPYMTDKEGFFDMLKRIMETDSLIVFVTARHIDFKDLAYKHFKDIGIENYKYYIHFCGSKSKGDYILKNVYMKGFKKIIFIDDLMHNLIDVKSKIPSCDCYSFKYLPPIDNSNNIIV